MTSQFYLTMKCKEIITLLLLCIGWIHVHTQQAVLTTGGDASGTGGSISYSIGQVTYITNSGTNGSAAEGVQQPYEISIIDALDEVAGSNFQVSAFPNPTMDLITLRIENYNITQLSYQLVDANGQLIESKSLTALQSDIAMSNLAAGTYFLKITDNGKTVRTFKILKA